MKYTEEEKIKYVQEFRNSHNFVYEFCDKKGILASELRKWIKEYPVESVSKSTEFGILDLTEFTSTTSMTEDEGFKFETNKIKIELKQGYDKILLRTLMGVLVG